MLGRALIDVRGHVTTSLSWNSTRVLDIDKLVLQQAGVRRLRVDGFHRDTLLLCELFHTIPHTLLRRGVDACQSQRVLFTMLLSLYVTAGLIGRHRLLFRLPFDRDSADGDNLALRHWVWLLLSRLFPRPRVGRRLVVRLLFDRSCGRSLLLLPLRLLLAHE